MAAIDLATLTHEDVNELINEDATAGCASCTARYSEIWWNVQAPEGCESLGGIVCHRCAAGREAEFASYAAHGEDVSGFEITRVETREQRAERLAAEGIWRG